MGLVECLLRDRVAKEYKLRIRRLPAVSAPYHDYGARVEAGLQLSIARLKSLGIPELGTWCWLGIQSRRRWMLGNTGVNRESGRIQLAVRSGSSCETLRG